VEESSRGYLGQRAQRGEVSVVAGSFAGERDVERVVVVIAPLGTQPVASGLPRHDQGRVVQVGLRNQREGAAEERAEGVRLLRHLLQDVLVTRVDERVHGIQPEAVNVVITHPHVHIVEDVPADSILGQVD
jgi:hypothetical protein